MSKIGDNQDIPEEIKKRVLDKCFEAVQRGEIINVYQEYEYQRKCYQAEGYDWKSPIECNPGLLVD